MEVKEVKKEEKDKRFKKKLMDLLKDDDDIRGIIYSICDSSLRLPRCEDEENEKIITLKASVQELKEINERLTKENENLRDEIEEKVYKDLERVLNPEVQICQNAETFFAYGVQEDNILALWNVMSMKHQEYESLHVLDKLKQLFGYFVNNYNNISTKECTLYSPLVGEEYDEREQNRTSDGNVSGTIEEVILPGFSIGKNIYKKPLVRVK